MIFILTGAGIGCESGLDAFMDRDRDTVLGRVRAEDAVTARAFARDPATALAFCDLRRHDLASGKHVPNAAHEAVARLQREAGEPVFLATLCLDDLHERAGCTRVLHLRGEMLSALCGRCGGCFRHESDLGPGDACPSCGEAGCMRPGVVFRGERPLLRREAAEALSLSRLFVSVAVPDGARPGDWLIAKAKASMAWTLDISPEPFYNYRAFDEEIFGPLSRILPEWVNAFLTGEWD
jgi:NAD-dependent deacetylase